jgi:hypothetical protein
MSIKPLACLTSHHFLCALRVLVVKQVNIISVFIITEYYCKKARLSRKNEAILSPRFLIVWNYFCFSSFSFLASSMIFWVASNGTGS